MMSLFINRRIKETNKREKLMKNAITTQLSETVKEIQLGSAVGDVSGNSYDVNNTVLCAILESIFLHGLKDSLISQARRIFADVDQRPEPSFWAPLMLISHKQIIEQIGKLSHVTSEIGQCRAWIRLALNDSLLSSYFFAMQQNSSSLKLYYETYAFARDSELLNVVQKFIEGLETSIIFSFPLNSSLLNVWPPESLLLAGIWSPTLKTCPVVSGIDVAQSMQLIWSTNSETSSLDSVVSSPVGIEQTLNEDEALKIILNKKLPIIDTDKAKQDQNQSKCPVPKTEIQNISVSTKALNSEINNTLGNSLSKHLGWSSNIENDNAMYTAAATEEESVPNLNNSSRSKSGETSYNALIESYYATGATEKNPNLSDILLLNDIDYYKIPELQSSLSLDEKLDVDQSKLFYLKIGTIAKEIGLDNQNFECKCCKTSLSPTIKQRMCAFSGYYYCENCISDFSIPIPARIVHNWDFKKYSVSKQAAEFIDKIKDYPTIDMKTINPSIYSTITEMAKLQKMRVQLNYLRDYMFTCHEPVMEKLKDKISAREYMYEHIHQYSISDLLEISDGILAQCVQEVVDFGKRHVLLCWICKQKGFICEVCRDSEVVYPFDIDKVYQCSGCNSVFHNRCLNKRIPCPKCKRKKKQI